MAPTHGAIHAYPPSLLDRVPATDYPVLNVVDHGLCSLTTEPQTPPLGGVAQNRSDSRLLRSPVDPPSESDSESKALRIDARPLRIENLASIRPRFEVDPKRPPHTTTP